MDVNQIQIQCIDVNPKEDVLTLIQKKLERTLKNYPFVTNSALYLRQGENDTVVLEARLKLKGGELFAKSQDPTFGHAIDQVIKKLRTQLERFKGKRYRT